MRGKDIKKDVQHELPDYTIQNIITYSADAVENFEVETTRLFQEINVLTLFSPRSGQILQQLLKKHGLTPCVQSIKLLCLSRAVLESVQELNWASCRVSEFPTDRSMIETLERIRHE